VLSGVELDRLSHHPHKPGGSRRAAPLRGVGSIAGLSHPARAAPDLFSIKALGDPYCNQMPRLDLLPPRKAFQPIESPPVQSNRQNLG
jgi:hypothetical protein